MSEALKPLKVGGLLKNLETGEVVKITNIDYFVSYKNDEVSGEVQASKLHGVFEIL